MSKNKINQLVKMEDLAAAYSALMGNRYNLSVDFNLKAKSKKEMAFMRATRQPYKISDIKAESMQIVMRFYIDCESKEKYLDDIQIITQLCGMNKMLFESNSLQYKAYSFLDFAEPLNDPAIDCGRWHTTVELRGNILVTQLEGGVLIGNEVETDITFNYGTTSAVSGKLEILSASTTLIKTQETPQMANSDTAKGFNQTQAYSYSYTLLILKNQICEKIVKILEGITPLGLNDSVRIVDHYPAFSGSAFNKTRDLIMTSGKINRQAGAFVYADITFQDKLTVDNTTDEDEETTLEFTARTTQRDNVLRIVNYSATVSNSGGSGSGSGGGSGGGTVIHF